MFLNLTTKRSKRSVTRFVLHSIFCFSKAHKMVLKRKRGEDFVTWVPGGQLESTKPGTSARSWIDDPAPPMKKAPAKQADQHNPPKPSAASSKLPNQTRASVSATATQAPPPTQSRNKRDANAPKPEKRSAIFKKKCPQNILERLDRVISQR